MGVPVQDVLFTVFQSIFQVFLLCLAGFTLSFKGIVDKSSSKVLNHINVALFTPALLFSKVAYFLTPAKLRQLWVIPIFFVVITALSAIVAHCLARACRLRRSQVNFATAASMFMNSNSLPVALMQSLATTVPLLRWGSDDTIDAMFGRSLTYLVVFSTLGMILRWSYGVRLLAQADEPDSTVIPPPTTYRDVDDDDPTSVDPSAAAIVGYETEPDVDPRNPHVWRTRRLRSRLHRPRLTPISRRFTYPHVRHSHLPAVPTSLGDQSESDDSDEVDTTEGDSEDTIALRSDPIDTGFSTEAEDQAPAPTPPPAQFSSDQPTRPSLFIRLLNMLTSLSPPLLASLFALFCVLVPPVQHILNAEEMIPFKGALDSAGACSIPVTLLVLGGWFWDDGSKPKRKHRRNDTATSDGQENAESQANAKNKGKGIPKRHVTVLPGHVDAHSRESSTASLSSLIEAFGVVLMGHGTGTGHARMRRRLDTSTDVETGPQLETHAETEIEHVENSRSQTDAVNGCVRPSSSVTSPLPTPRGNPSGETLTVIVTLVARMVLVPLVATPLMVLVSRLGWGGEVFEDPVFIVSSMLLIASPPALTLAQISQRAKSSTGADKDTAPTDADTFSPFERLLSRTVFWAYLVLTPPITIVSVMVGLLLIEN